MAISFIGSAENSAADGNDVTLTLPGGMQQNDLVIVAYAIGDNDDVDFNMAMVTSGYTEIHDLFSNDVRDCNLGVFYKFMPATPDSSAQVDGQGGTDAAVAAVCMVFRGVDTTTPFDVTSTSATGLNTMHPDPPSIDHNAPSGLWTVIAGASAHTVGVDTYTFPTGYTTNAIDRGLLDTTGVSVGMGYRTDPSDPENPGVMTHAGLDSANYSWCAVTMALRPIVDQTLVLSAAVLTLLAPTSTLLAESTLGAGAPVVTFSAPTAALITGGDQTLNATTPIVTFTAPTSILLAETALTAGAPVVAFTAPVSILLAESILAAGAPVVTFTAPISTVFAESTIAAGAPVVTFTAPTANLAIDQILTANAAILTLTAPTSNLLAESFLIAGAPVVTFTAPISTLFADSLLVATTPIITFTAPVSTLFAESTLETNAPLVTFTAPTAILSQAGGLFNYYTGLNAVDTNSAWRWALQDRYSVDNLDIAPLLARYLQEHTGNDSTRAYRKLEDICRGLQPPDA